jgi:ABC-2 type transport system permease protein
MTTAHAEALSVSSPERRPLSRLAQVEGRKMLDTRAGRWLLALTGLLAAGVALAAGLTADQPELVDGLRTVGATVATVVPVLGILLVSSEWSQRTALITFALVPRRERVIAAKLIAAAGVATLATVASLAVAAAGMAVAGGDFALPVTELGRAELLQLLTVVMGLSLGLALMNSALAIALSFAAPSLMTVLGSVWPSVDKVVTWIDPTTFAEMLSEDKMAGGDWARMGTTAALWIALPALVGLMRLRRSEVK